MRIAIVGGGSIGLLYTYFLSDVHEVTLFVRNDMQRKVIEENGMILGTNGELYEKSITTRPIADWDAAEVDLSIICVKQYHLQELLRKDARKKWEPLLFLQNGMEHIDWIESLQLPSVLVGIVEHGALKKEDNVVIHTGKGITKIAILRGLNTSFVEALTNPCQSNFPFQLEPDFEKMLMKKLVVNSVINPLTAILKVENGVLLDNHYFYQLFHQLFSEVASVLNIEQKEEAYSNVVEVCRKTSHNRSSMLKDIEEKRQTEVDAILGYLLKMAKKKEIKAPMIYALYQMIKGMELERRGC